jgi:hypothetical protein
MEEVSARTRIPDARFPHGGTQEVWFEESSQIPAVGEAVTVQKSYVSKRLREIGAVLYLYRK